MAKFQKRIKPKGEEPDMDEVESPPLQVESEAAPPVERLFHALDSSPVNSKIVVTSDGAFLATPERVSRLLKPDPAAFLPEGAKIQKLGEKKFLSRQLSPSVDHPDLTHDNALQAIAAFVPHFHSV